jgi:large subunit ribosomal protein L22
LVAAVIRGRKVTEAVTVLQQTPKRATGPVGKVLASAVANAENNYNMSARNLVVESVLVGPGPSLKRFRPRAQGRAYPVLKRTSHITVVLSEVKEAASPAKPAAASVTATAKTDKPTTKEAK